MRQSTWRWRPGAFLSGCLLLGIMGCASLEKRAPLVTPSLTSVAKARGVGPDTLDRGRALYVGRCARCHQPVGVNSRSRRQWQAILPRMADQAKLGDDEFRDLEAYIEAVGELPAGQ
jgi:mono/diheme cytochrome c family protein